MSEPLAPEARALILAALGKRVAEEEKLARAVFSGTYLAGAKQTFRSPLDDALGYVQRTDPDVEWRVVDEAALREHLAQFPGCVEVIVEITPGDMAEALAVLQEHAPHLLTERADVSRDAIADAVAQSKATGEAAAPGIARVRPGGVLRVVPHKDAGHAVARLVQAGLLDWSQVLELPAAEEAAS